MNDSDPSVRKYEFRASQPETERGYCLFDDLEDDDNIFFHGTSEAAYSSIIQEGFRTGRTVYSVSFAMKSSGALEYACKPKSGTSNGRIIAVRYDGLQQGPGVVIDPSMIHIYKVDYAQKRVFEVPRVLIDMQPEIIGYCIIPPEYVHR